MVHVELLQIEIQNLKDALDTSQKKAERYSQLGAFDHHRLANRTDWSVVSKLYDELEKLRRNICHDCKKKFVLGTVSLENPAPSLDNASAATSSAVPPIDKIDNSIPAISLSTSESISDIAVHTPVTNSGPEQSRISPKAESPKFSVEHNPEVKRTLALHLEHVFTHESRVLCVKISPDGQRMAVGSEYSEATNIYDMKSRSNVRSVSESLVSAPD